MISPHIMVKHDRLKVAKEVLGYLKKGKRNAITGAMMAQRMGYPNDRQIRVAILDLIRSGVPVAASVGKPPGFFIAETLEERKMYIDNCIARIKGLAVHLRDFKRATITTIEPKQLKLRIE